MVKKVIVFVVFVSILLVVGIVIGRVVLLPNANGGDKDLKSGNKMVRSFCSVTDDKKLCVNTLNKANSSNDPKDFYKVAIEATIEALKNSFNLLDSLLLKKDYKNTTEGQRIKMSVGDCNELLHMAVEDLKDTLSVIEESDSKSLHEHMPNIQTWLTAVATYQSTCTDQLEEAPLIHNEMQNGTLNATKLTSMDLAMVANFENIMESVGFKLDVKPNSRRLLGDTKAPTWFTATDRKLLATNEEKPNAVVAQDGTGQFKTIVDALRAYPKNFKGRYIIYVKSGIYREYPVVEKYMKNIFIYGDGSRKTRVTGDKSYAKGIQTMNTASFAVLGDGFIAKNMGFQNTAGPEGHQAVALHVNGDMAIFYNCRIDAYQDTLYIHAKRQFFRNCIISGTVDFIFGNAQTIIQNCKIIVRKPSPGQKNLVTAHGRGNINMNSGVVIHNCNIVPEVKLENERFTIETYLGRPWKQYSTTIIMESNLHDFIQPQGWYEWDAKPHHNDYCYFAEYKNFGSSANTTKRATWNGVRRTISREEALGWTVQNFLKGDSWIKPSEVPCYPLLRKAYAPKVQNW